MPHIKAGFVWFVNKCAISYQNVGTVMWLIQVISTLMTNNIQVYIKQPCSLIWQSLNMITTNTMWMCLLFLGLTTLGVSGKPKEPAEAQCWVVGECLGSNMGVTFTDNKEECLEACQGRFTFHALISLSLFADVVVNQWLNPISKRLTSIL